MTKEVLDVIKKLRNKDISVIIVTHEIKFARDIADRVIFLHNGQILENDTPDNVFNNSKNQIIRDFLSSISED